MMQIKDVMTREVEVIRPDATLEDAAAKMDALNIGSLPVCDGDRVLGMITDRDITVRATAVGGDPTAIRTRDVMSADVIYGFEDQDVKDAAKLMREAQIRRLIILNRDKRLVGIVALGDLAVDSDAQMAGKTLKQVSEPAEPDR
jgi:CBS domain-containing protein